METPVTIEVDDICLEGVLNKVSESKAVVVCHPHPLYGGRMDNPVVNAISRAYVKKGYSSLCFNFRGAGGSSGQFDDGIGEQDDVRAAVSMLIENGYESIALAGYSFGSRINAEVVSTGLKVEDHVMVSPPVAFMSFDSISALSSTGLIVIGDHDEYAPADLIAAHIKKWKISPQYEIIKNCDHFYSSGLGKLEEILQGYLS